MFPEKPDGCLDWDVLVGGLCGDSLDAASFLVPSDFRSKSFSGPLAQNVSETYCYPAPLPAEAVQDPGFLQTRDEAGTEPETSPDCVSTPPVPQNSFLQTHSNKHLDSYIYSLLQRRAQPIRTSRPRTSFSTDPSKSILRQASLCGRLMSIPGSGFGNPRSLFPALGTTAESGLTSSLQKKTFMETRSEELNGIHGDMIRTSLRVNSSESGSPGGSHIQNSGSVSIRDSNTKRGNGSFSHSVATLLKDFRNQESSSANSSHKKTCQTCCPTNQELVLPSSLAGDDVGTSRENHPGTTQTSSPRNGLQLYRSGPAKNTEKSVPQLSSLGGSSKNLRSGGREEQKRIVGNGWSLPAKQQNLKDRRGSSKNIKTSKMALKTLMALEANELPSERKDDKSCHKFSSRTILLLEDAGSANVKASRRGTSISERQVLDKHAKSNSLQSGGSKPHRHTIQRRHHNHHHRVCNQPKHKRTDHRRLRVIAEIPSGGAKKSVLKRQRHLHPPSGGQQGSPYSYVTGSDSEYSAECLSLFHSTIVDTSEDERSNYTTNCFGDSESSEEESMEENGTTTDPEESVGGGPVVPRRGKGRRQSGAKQDSHLGHTKTLIKIKASHNLKKKILGSRSGSLKLMTTV